MTTQERQNVIRWANRAMVLSGRAYQRGDYIAARSHMETYSRYTALLKGAKP